MHHTPYTSACRRPDKYRQQPCNLLRTLVGLSQPPTRSLLLVCSCELKPQHPLVLYQVSRECGTFFKWQAEHEMRQYGVCCQLLMLIIHLYNVTTMKHRDRYTRTDPDCVCVCACVHANTHRYTWTQTHRVVACIHAQILHQSMTKTP